MCSDAPGENKYCSIYNINEVDLTWLLNSITQQYLQIPNTLRYDFEIFCYISLIDWDHAGLIQGLCPASERRRYFVKTSLID